jgi:hypothetical protein
MGRAQALYCGLWLLRVWTGLRTRGLDCRLSPKTRSTRARAFGFCSKNPSQHVGPGSNPALRRRRHVRQSPRPRVVWSFQMSKKSCVCAACGATLASKVDAVRCRGACLKLFHAGCLDAKAGNAVCAECMPGVGCWKSPLRPESFRTF